MGWQHSLLGGNVVSSYEHIDNLANDLRAGKFWDSAGAQYTKIAHGGTNGYLETSAGALLSYPKTGEFRVYNEMLGVATHYTGIKNLGASGTTINATAGAVYINNTAGDPHLRIGSGSAQSRVYLYDATAAAWKYIAIDNGAAVIG